MKTYNWRPFLERWSADWLDSPGARGQGDVDETVLRDRWLGFPAAGEDRITELEARLGVTLPPTYRSFLATTDGWRPAGTAVSRVGAAEGVHWYGDPDGLQAVHEGELDEHASEEEVLRAGMWGRALRLSATLDTVAPGTVSPDAVASDTIEVLLDPGDPDANGEWAAYLHRGVRSGGERTERHGSFMDLMQALFREFHRAHGGSPGFVNETTRELDADIEQARLACLDGEDIDGALELLTEADECGRPRARGLRVQMEAMLRGGSGRGDGSGGGSGSGGGGGGGGGSDKSADLRVVGRMDDPLYARELLPPAALEHLRAGHDEAEFLPFPDFPDGRDHDGDDRKQASALLREIDERTFRYEAPGPFGDAVASAREQARWGDTDGAWRTVAAAVAGWEPYGEEHIAPVGLLADPLLGPVITAERGRYLLETPRAGGQGAADDGDEDEAPRVRADGLGWLAEDTRPPAPDAYRFVLVHGVTPQELAGRIGQGPLLAPCDESEAGQAIRIGSCGVGVGGWDGDGDGASDGGGGRGTGDGGWSFAFESGRNGTEAPSEAVSRGTKSVTVWCERGGRSAALPGTFHFSYAEDGQRVYGFTVRDGETEEWGVIPDALDPGHLFPDADLGWDEDTYEDAYDDSDEGEDAGPGSEDTSGPGSGSGSVGNWALDPDDEYESLDAIAEVFGISLPHFAIRHGRLHAVAPS
ncbi:SMI1/KNR4 family protein [Streptomyces scopuliridis]|uniref:SMI1/KNR4 family protein n=1 Tax=Streptomyces scopuliridis TaxID=452529 RepID=UPI0036799610